MTRNLLRTMAASASVLPGAAMALGLGPIDVKTVLDQPLEAHIPIVSARPGELNGVTANLASRELFQRMGLERPSLLRQLDFKVEGLDTGEPYIRVTSKTPMREPSINILLEISWASGRMLRDFSVLLDPPLSVRQAPRNPTVAVAPAARNRVSAPSFSRPPRSAGFDGTAYGPVASGETLWSIAELMRPDRSISVSQMMLALLRANPDAFYQPNVNSLNAGAMLRMPASDELAALSRGEAKVEVDRQHAAIGASWAPTTSTVDTGPSETAETASERDSKAMAASDLGGNPSAGLGQIRLVDADDASADNVTGDATGSSASASGQGPLIQLESGGLALQLVGLEGLSERMPTIIGVHDAALATEIVSAQVEERLPVAVGELPGAEISVPEIAEFDASVDVAADFTEIPEVSATGLDGSAEEGSEAIAAAQAFRAQTGIPSMAGANGDLVPSEPTADLTPDLGLAGVGLDALGSTSYSDPATIDADGSVTATSTDDLLDFQSATSSPLEAETFDTVAGNFSADLQGEQVAADEVLGAEFSPLSGEDTEQMESLGQLTGPDEEPTEIFFEESGSALAPLDTENGDPSFEGASAAFPSPKSIATYGGGVLAVLLLMLALIRRSLGGKDTEPPLVAQNDGVMPVDASEDEDSEAVADTLETTAVSDTPELEASKAATDEEEVDPAEKADILIAMGEHAQAVDLLEKALQETPDNAHVALKILRTHVSADSGNAFAEFAASNRELLQGSGLWPQVVTMGTELCPEHEMFGGTANAGEQQEESADAPARPLLASQELPSIGSMIEESAAEPPQEDDAEQADEDSSADVLEFKLPEHEEEEQTDLVAEESQTKSAEEDDLDLGLDFDLEEFSLDGSNEEADGPVPNPSVDASDLAEPLAAEFESPPDEIDAGEEAFGDDATLKVESVSDFAEGDIDPTLKVAAISDFPNLKFDDSEQEDSGLDLDLEGDEAPASSAASEPKANDEDSFVETKLDLATAYLEMGDSDGARSLYEEVVEEGNDTQRKMAEDALAKMG